MGNIALEHAIVLHRHGGLVTQLGESEPGSEIVGREIDGVVFERQDHVRVAVTNFLLVGVKIDFARIGAVLTKAPVFIAPRNFAGRNVDRAADDETLEALGPLASVSMQR